MFDGLWVLVVGWRLDFALFAAVSFSIIFAVSSRRNHERGEVLWWAILGGILLVCIPPYVWTLPLGGFETYPIIGGALGAMFGGPWLLAWGIRGKKIAAGTEGPRKGVIYTSSEMEDFKRRGLM